MMLLIYDHLGGGDTKFDPVPTQPLTLTDIAVGIGLAVLVLVAIMAIERFAGTNKTTR
jgi:multisubunit Na+/H+ antiporter MnhC subunit